MTTKLKLDNIKDELSTVIKTDRDLKMLQTIRKYSYSQLDYKEVESTLGRLNYRFSSMRGGGRCKVLVTCCKSRSKIMFEY